MGFGLGSIASFGTDALGGYFGYDSARKASRASNKSITKANKLLEGKFGETAGEFSPYMKGGTSALDALMASYGLNGGPADYSGFENSPDYQFAQQSGVNAIDRSGAARGHLFSGGQLKALTQFGQGNAAQYLGNYRNGLQGLSNLGFNATNALGGYRQNLATNVSNNLIGIGNNNAARELAKGNFLGGLVNSAQGAFGSTALPTGGGG